MMRKLILFITLLILYPGYSQSGNIGDKLSEVIPPSIDHYNFVKYGNISLNNNSGGFSHSIPLYTLSNGEIETNLSLSYYNDGVKVNDIAGIVGMNWNLNAGGMITRIVRDEPDEFSQDMTFRPAYNEVIEILNGNYSDDYYLQNIKEKAIMLYKSAVKSDAFGDYSKVDNEQDWFSFNFNGYSGTFFLENNTVYINSNVEGIKAYIENDSVYGSRLLKFTFYTPDGKIYTFGGHSDFIESSETITNCSKSYGMPVASTWFLREISYNNKSVFFQYKNYWKEYAYDYSESVSVGNITVMNNGCHTYPSFNECIVFFKSPNAKTISEISTDSWRALFDYQEYREDYSSGVFLKKIDVYSFTNKIKTIDFVYNYSLSDNVLIPTKVMNQNEIKKRLFLEELSFGNNEIYKFEYNNYNLLPARLSYRQDYFGYANTNNYAGLLNINDFNGGAYNNLIIKNHHSGADKANRSINSITSKYGSLTKIMYPT